MFKKKYHKTGGVLLTIFLLAIILVAAAVIYAYMSGIRYIKTSTNTKFFGFVDKNDNISSGRFWFEDGTTVSVEPQKYYIVEIKDVDAASMDMLSSILYELNVSPADDALEMINETLGEDVTGMYPLNHFVFNSTEEGVIFCKYEASELLKDYDRQKNPPVSGEFHTYDETTWILMSTKTSVSSYKDFEIVQSDDRGKKYKGDILTLLANEKISFAALTLKNENLIYLYPAPGVFRFSYENGNNAKDLYIGGTKNNFQKDGKGIYYYSKTGDICYGTFEADKKTGKFKILYADGDSYDGDLIDSKKDGEGIFAWSNGTTYEGQFKNDMKHGTGINRFADGSVYSGEYSEDAKHGEGTYTFSNGDVYTGSFENDVFSGKGSYQWASGEYYTGDFENNVIHGEGIYSWTSGRTYKGYFENGKMVREK